MKLLLLLLACAWAKPGVPQIRWAERNYALVSLNPQAVSYENLIVGVHDSVSMSVEWDVWFGSTGESAFLLVDGDVVKEGSRDDLDRRRLDYDIAKGGRFQVAVRLCDEQGCSESDAVEVVVADTDGSHLPSIPYVWEANNKPYSRSTDHLVIGAYFVEWGVYDRQFPADRIPIPNLTHLLYGFVPMCGGDGINDALKQVPGSFEALQRSCEGRDDFKVSIHDIWGALQKPQKGVEAYSEMYKGNFGQLMAIRKHNPHLTILPSIGGWTLSDPFYQLNDTIKRKVFVESVEEFLETWKFFDGVDIDWEFPGGKGANPALGNVTVDGVTYQALLGDLRSMLDGLETRTGRKYLLTSAISGGYDKINVVEYGAVQEYLDHIFVMTYDFKGAWSNTDLGLQTPLYAPTWNPTEKYTTAFAVQRLLNQSVNPNKLVVGVAMYGRGWRGIHNITNNNPFTGTATGPVKGSWENGVVDYKDITNRYPNPNYDGVAQAPYVYHNDDLVTYDDERSVTAKGKYVIQKGLGGLFGWEIDADNGDLLNSMNQGLGNTPMTANTCSISSKYTTYKCPFSELNVMC
ncbi:chitinase [Plodia interpunctella granulovirus]|uniref:Chitinase n=1 Tax=Plodia interpunctella granulovirus TaxID=262175 RepID=A0A1L5JGH0_9BBAC|nr:chitinase [Plodia interpunctella granulovirus]APO13894.1 chitinase [Plodia interpunctella granulovirus]